MLSFKLIGQALNMDIIQLAIIISSGVQNTIVSLSLLDYLGYSLRKNTIKIRNKTYRAIKHKRKMYLQDIVLGQESEEKYLQAVHSWWGMYAFLNTYKQQYKIPSITNKYISCS